MGNKINKDTNEEMNKYQGTYLSTLPADVIRELDKYQEFVNDEYFMELTNKILMRINRLAKIDPHKARMEIIQIHNIFRRYGITSQYLEISIKPYSSFEFYLHGKQNINKDLLEDLGPYSVPSYMRFVGGWLGK